MQDNPLPADDDYHTVQQILAKRPALTARALRTLAEEGRLPFWRRTAGKTAERLFKLTDVDLVIGATYKPATKGPLAQAVQE